MRIFPNYVIDVIPSKQHFTAWLGLSLIMHLTIGFCLKGLELHMPVVILITSGSYLISVALAVMTKMNRYSLIINECGDLTYHGSAIMTGQLLARSHVTTWYVFLCFNRSIDQKNMRLLIWRDAVIDRDYRRLCRIIRLKRQMI